MIELKMLFQFGSLCSDIHLWSKKENRFLKAIAIFDTGAHTTHIDTNALINLGYDVDNADKSSVSTIGSKNMSINNIVIDSLKLDNVELGPVLANFSDLSDINFPVILGMNIIKEFNVNLDFEKKLISMKPAFDVNCKIPIERFNKNNSRFGMWTIQQK